MSAPGINAVDKYKRQFPLFGEASFACPHCHAFAQQQWFTLGALAGDPPRREAKASAGRLVHVDQVSGALGGVFRGDPVRNVRMTQCLACDESAVWVGNTVSWPPHDLGVPHPIPEMPEAVRIDFEEAAAIFRRSPRAAAALLRLGLEKLCRHLEKKGDLNAMIGQLVEDGLDPRLQKAFDYVRVMGNEAVHPGQIEISDTEEVVATLFRLLNLIVERLIKEDAEIEALYRGLPAAKLEGIAQRDTLKT